MDFDRRRVGLRNPEGQRRQIRYDRLVLAAGSVSKLLPIPGVAEYAHGFRGIPEALYLRDHLIRQVDEAAVTDDPAERAARLTFVVVGAGYTGTEVAAHGQLLTRTLAAQHPRLRPVGGRAGGTEPRWVLVELAPTVLPELDRRLARTATKVLRRRGVEIRTESSVAEARPAAVRLADGEDIPTRTLVWCVGVRPDPLVEALGLDTDKGRVVVDAHLNVPGRPEVYAIGDAAAVPNPAAGGEIAPMTAQHAVRQGKLAARNIAASLGYGTRRSYRHHDLGFVVDLGGIQAAANPLGIPLGGPLAAVVTHGYHLLSIPGNRLRIASEWLLEAVLPRQTVQLGLVQRAEIPLETASPELIDARG